MADDTPYIESKEPNRPLSRYNSVRTLLNEDQLVVQQSWDIPDIPVMTSDRYFDVTIEFAHRPDLISLKYYGTEQLYWVIAAANDLVDPFAETTVNKKLRIPDRDYVFQTLLVR